MSFIIHLIVKIVNSKTYSYNKRMENLVKKQIKRLLLEEDLKLKELAFLLSEKYEKKYSPDSLSHKIARNSITYSEMVCIAEILGYEIKFIKK